MISADSVVSGYFVVEYMGFRSEQVRLEGSKTMRTMASADCT